MPTYAVTSQAGLLSNDMKAHLAKAITEAHADVTGAPPYFAQVLFRALSQSDMFVGGRPLSHEHVFVFGHIRDGRSAVDRKRLVNRLSDVIARITDLPKTATWVYLHELPAAAMIEFGHVLPQAGDEALWTDALPAADRVFMQSLTAE